MQYVMVFIAAVVAYGTGRSVIIWSFLTYTFGFWALLPLAFLPINHKRLQDRIDWIKDIIEEDKPEGYKDFDTVDDLMKQL
jgi:hypothetical protein